MEAKPDLNKKRFIELRKSKFDTLNIVHFLS